MVEVLYGESPPPIMIIGHSMGGAIAVHTAVANHVPSLLGLCVIDVVEGNTMMTFLHFHLCLLIWYYGVCYYCLRYGNGCFEQHAELPQKSAKDF